MQKNFKISILNKPYVLATDEQEFTVEKAVERIQLLLTTPHKNASSREEQAVSIALELAVELEKVTKQLDDHVTYIHKLLKSVSVE